MISQPGDNLVKAELPNFVELGDKSVDLLRIGLNTRAIDCEKLICIFRGSGLWHALFYNSNLSRQIMIRQEILANPIEDSVQGCSWLRCDSWYASNWRIASAPPGVLGKHSRVAFIASASVMPFSSMNDSTLPVKVSAGRRVPFRTGGYDTKNAGARVP